MKNNEINDVLIEDDGRRNLSRCVSIKASTYQGMCLEVEIGNAWIQIGFSKGKICVNVHPACPNTDQPNYEKCDHHIDLSEYISPMRIGTDED